MISMGNSICYKWVKQERLALAGLAAALVFGPLFDSRYVVLHRVVHGNENTHTHHVATYHSNNDCLHHKNKPVIIVTRHVNM